MSPNWLSASDLLCFESKNGNRPKCRNSKKNLIPRFASRFTSRFIPRFIPRFASRFASRFIPRFISEICKKKFRFFKRSNQHFSAKEIPLVISG